jgi:hypothetical protein
MFFHFNDLAAVSHAFAALSISALGNAKDRIKSQIFTL